MSTAPRDAGHVPTPSSTQSADPNVPNANLKRRRFLLALGAGSAATAAAASQAIAAAAPQAVGGQATSAKLGYHETDHIRDYYASTRI